jgi:tetratricopeptide (TPR) repeat protein
MKRTGYLGVSLFVGFVVAVLPSAGLARGAQAAPAAQSAPAAQGAAAAQGVQPQAKTPAEYNAYKAVYDATAPAQKAELGEKFLTEFKDSQLIPNTYRMIIGAYAGAQNWPKVLDAADRAAASPAADDKLKAYAYANAMLAAQNTNNVDKVISYGEKVLAIDPNDLNTMITLSAVIPAKLPTDEAGKKAALDKAASLATKALAGVEPMLAKADEKSKPQLVQIEGNLHATLGLVAYNRPDYMKSIQEYELAIKNTPKDDVAHFYLGLDYQALAAQASRDYQTALKAENDAKAARADQPTIDELAAKRGGLEEDIRKYRDKAIDEFAIATALAGPVAAQAKDTLTKLWTGKNNDTNGLDEFIAQKKQQVQ